MQFRVKPADNFIWNLSDLVKFLIDHQGQKIVIETGTEGCCARAVGLYHWLDKFEFESVTIKTGNPLERHDRYQVEIVLPWKFVHVSQPVDSVWHTWNQHRVFGTAYGRPLWHRLGIAAHLLTHHPDRSAVGFTVDPANINQRELFELTQLWQHSPSSATNFAGIWHKFPLYHADADAYTPGAHLTDGYVAQTKRIYQHFLIDIVAETFISGDCFFITEKTIRPMLLKKPFIAMGPQNYLDYLHQMGFRTFGDFWDEDYDGYSAADRYHKILMLIDHLATRDTKELETMYWDMQYTLDYNYNLLLNQKFKTNIVPI
jgi:hypothetical protein